MPKSRIVPYNGSPAVEVDGRIIPPMAFTAYAHTSDREYLRALGDAGIEIYFLICDPVCGDNIVKAVSKLGHSIQGLVLIEPALTGKAREIYVRYGLEFLTIKDSMKGDAVSLIEDYLEERGALK